MGSDSSSVYNIYSYTKDNDVHLESFNESGAYKILNDKGIEIVAGKKGSEGNVDICITRFRWRYLHYSNEKWCG